MKKIILVIIICLCFVIIFDVGIAQGTLYWGSSGPEVKTLQTKLKNWGYYDGPIDGVFGGGTFTAVKEFQRKNGLTVDGVVGPRTAEKLGMSIKGNVNKTDYKASSGGMPRNDEVILLAKAITGEARGEPYIGQVAVGAVILNRTRHPSFPNTIAGVIYQPGAFTAVSDGQINLPPEDSCVKAAQDALNGWDPTGGCLYYWNPATATSKWIWSRKVVKKIGKHWFGN
ncbi:spore cortex-lytic enzyme [Crassaminicella indica]|uniref:Spore cortex-lytic enzyme n=1 Tax=Crassaminicella indica TaxID=2855394 RepID=A0ABX8REC4_9CLOT|nr:spore cortex-lytic enzyme [Crassaminicella indica]QXM06782.1 spore cortex-lytic enzyme [Crassaminicella indica]